MNSPTRKAYPDPRKTPFHTCSGGFFRCLLSSQVVAPRRCFFPRLPNSDWTRRCTVPSMYLLPMEPRDCFFRVIVGISLASSPSGVSVLNWLHKLQNCEKSPISCWNFRLCNVPMSHCRLAFLDRLVLRFFSLSSVLSGTYPEVI